ncbi:hypothetical protein K2Q08_00870, partial [Patescibacteria group bacterium]|nr:hypothetical protein [Patescibacteria group bacterium]
QHGILSVFDGDYSKDPSSEYIAEYGPLVRAQLESHNFAPRSHFLDIGSPRFDEYLQHSSNKKVANKYFEILHIGPQLSPGEWNDSYDVFEYFKTMVDAVRGIADAHVTIKLRGGYNDHFFFRKLITELFAGLSYTLVASEPLSTLLEKADVVVSCHSTAYLEALLLGRPVVMDASMPIYRALAEADLEPAREAGALIVAETPAKLKEVLHLLATDISERDTLSARAEQFVLENYLLKDGKSSERLAQAVRVLAGRS